MRILLSLGVYLASALMALSQDLREIPETEPLPATISASVQAGLATDDILHGISRWEGNLAGDANPDQLVQAAYSPNGGNGVYVFHWIFIGSPDGFQTFFPIEIAGSITTAAIESNALVVTVPRLLPGEPRCCPSGSEVIRLPLN